MQRLAGRVGQGGRHGLDQPSIVAERAGEPEVSPREHATCNIIICGMQQAAYTRRVMHDTQRTPAQPAVGCMRRLRRCVVVWIPCRAPHIPCSEGYRAVWDTLLRHRADEPENLFSEGVSPHAPIAAVRAVAAPPAPAEPVDVDAVLLTAIPPRLKVPPPPPWTQRSHARGYKRAARARTHPRTPASMRARTRTHAHTHTHIHPPTHTSTHARTYAHGTAAWQVLKRLLRKLALAHMAQQPDAYSVRPCRRRRTVRTRPYATEHPKHLWYDGHVSTENRSVSCALLSTLKSS
jgi:hypothetical protein